MATGFARKYPALFSGDPFGDSDWDRAGARIPEVRRLNQKARMNEWRRDLRRRVNARIAEQRAAEQETQ